MRARELHSNYYRDRWSESDLCNDFPGDEIFIDGLYAMQRHFDHNGVNLTIPVVQVMNTAHFLVAYMFSNPCSGDRMEYDSLADISLGKDRQMYRVTMIVLAAMLARTEGFRARQCRNLILDNRDPDFDEGVTLYDRFLRSAEKRFAEEDFLIDTQQLIKRVNEQKEIIAQQNYEIQTLKYTITTMENQQNNQYNNCVIYQAPVYNTNTTNNYYQQPVSKEAEEIQPIEEPEPVDSIIFTKKAKKEGKETEIIAALQKSVQGRKDKTRAFVQELREWQQEDYIDAHYNARVMYDELVKLTPLTFGYEVFKKYYNNTI